MSKSTSRTERYPGSTSRQSGKASAMVVLKAKLLANGDKWEQALAANLAADAPYK